MSILRLYHGSESKVESPEFGLENPRNDYGLGIYYTEHMDMAKEWAVRNGYDDFANEYHFDTTGLRILDLNEEDYTILYWIAVLLQNRIS